MLKKTMVICATALIVFCSAGCQKGNSGANPSKSTEKQKIVLADVPKRFLLVTCPIQRNSSMAIRYRRLSNYLQKSAGFEIALYEPKDSKDFRKKIKNQEVDFLFVDPALYLEIKDSLNKDHLYSRISVLDGELKGRPFETGSIFVRADSGIKAIKDTKGKTASIGSRQSATKWIAAMKLFLDNGVDPEKDLAGYMTGEKCKDIVLDVFYKKKDVGCVRTFAGPFRDIRHYQGCGIDVNQLLLLAETDPVNTWVFTCTKRVDSADMEKIACALLNIAKLDPQEKEVLTREFEYGFVKVDDSDFDGLRNMAEMVRLERKGNIR
ncbi:PhnD/SsuA/transferrin family substrate-binding protein [bacterium]|nr:PhnD/SsuA/transferrin family substrate-binding protein [bacterium]